MRLSCQFAHHCFSDFPDEWTPMQKSETTGLWAAVQKCDAKIGCREIGASELRPMLVGLPHGRCYGSFRNGR